MGEPEPGQIVRFHRPMVSFYPEGHPSRTTHRGPLIPRGAELVYVGPYPDRDGMHLAETRYDGADGQPWSVPFKLEDLTD